MANKVVKVYKIVSLFRFATQFGQLFLVGYNGVNFRFSLKAQIGSVPEADIH